MKVTGQSQSELILIFLDLTPEFSLKLPRIYIHMLFFVIFSYHSINEEFVYRYLGKTIIESGIKKITRVLPKITNHRTKFIQNVSKYKDNNEMTVTLQIYQIIKKKPK